jgi:hypothetical protein
LDVPLFPYLNRKKIKIKRERIGCAELLPGLGSSCAIMVIQLFITGTYTLPLNVIQKAQVAAHTV